MNLIRKIFDNIGYILVGSILGLGMVAGASSAAVIGGFQGGTGTSTAQVSDVGNYLQVASSSPFLTYKFSPANPSTTIIGITSMTAGQWMVASGAFSAYSTSSQPGLTFTASGTNMFFSGPSTTGTVVGWVNQNPTFGMVTSTVNLALSYSSASRCLRLDANKNVVAATGDCTAGDTTNPSTTIPVVTSMTAGQWVVANGAFGLYSTSSQPGITFAASGTTGLTVSGPSTTGTVVYGLQSNLTLGNVTTTNFSATTITDSQNNKYSTSTLPGNFGKCYGNETQNSIDVAQQAFFSTSTVRSKIYAGNYKSGDGTSVASGSVTFNLGFTTSTSAATSTWMKLFTSDQTVKSNGTSTILTVNGSTTWSGAGGNWLLGYYTTANSSSSEFCFDGFYDLN